jgi:hypothetical protein
MTWNTDFIIFVTGRYHWLVQPLLHFYEQYMPVPLTFFSDRPIEGTNYKEVFPRDMPIYKEPCCRLIKDALRKLDKPLVMFGYMDLLPISEVNLSHLKVLEQHVLSDSRVARANLWANAQWRIRNFPVVSSHPGLSIHSLSADDPSLGAIGSTHLIHALWNKRFLLSFMEDGWALDAVERDGPAKFRKQSHWYSIGTFPGLFNTCHLCYTADPTEVRLSTILKETDREYVAQYIPEGMWIG